MLHLLVSLLLICSVFAAPTNLEAPTDDLFYSAPAGYESAALGDILKYRYTPAQVKTLFLDAKIKHSWQLLVRSEDSFGNPSVVVSTLFEPYNADPSKLVSYQTAQDAAYLNCAPSYSYMDGGGLKTLAGQAEMLLIQTALEQGWYVVSPDYEGLKSAFTAGIQAAHGVLDSLRGALASSNFSGLNSDAQTVLWGYSGGSLASGWAAALQPNYAPELASNLLGVAVGGWVTNITATVVNVSGSLFAGLGATGMNGLSNEYPELAAFVKQETYSAKYDAFKKAEEICLLEAIVDYAFQNYFEGDDRYFEDGYDILTSSPTAEILTNNTLGLVPENMPEIPVFVYHGSLDSIVPFDQAVRVYDTWCDAGIKSFEFAVDLTAGHITETIQGSGAAFAWVKDRFEGNAVVSGCQKTERLNNLLYPGTDAGLAAIIQGLADNLLGLNIGPNGENLILQGNTLISKTNATSV